MISLPRLATPPSCGRASCVGTSEAGGCSLFLDPVGRLCAGAAGADGSVLVLRLDDFLDGFVIGGVSATDLPFGLAGLVFAAVLGSGSGVAPGLVAAFERVRAGFGDVTELVITFDSVGGSVPVL